MLIILSAFTLSCESRYITTVNVDTGLVRTVVEERKITEIGDTVILQDNNLNYKTMFYGFYKGSLPETKMSIRGNDSTKLTILTYSRAIRIK